VEGLGWVGAGPGWTCPASIGPRGGFTGGRLKVVRSVVGFGKVGGRGGRWLGTARHVVLATHGT
jgi:hypothetical protein